jgi:serine/threonine-protein kinase HipA
MSRPQKKEIYVYADWHGLKELTLVGKLFAEIHRAKEIFSFEYDQQWLDSKYAQSLDPALELFAGRQYPSNEKKNFGIFLDSSPDRWGRTLLERREAHSARVEVRKSRTMLESDFLLGVYDGHRMGALRFKLNPLGLFLDDNQENASPPWTSLRDLQDAAQKLEKKDSKDVDVSKAIKLLIAPGSSLGGARPKSSVVDAKGALWIAKFPSADDRRDVGAWEMVVHELGKKAGIDVPDARLEKFSGPHHTFLTRRFDRSPKGGRLHFASAMTLLGRNDGDNFEKGASYLEFVDFLATRGSRPEADLEQLWRRVLFFVCVSNVDDHLRNHGFLLDEKGWRLAPAYDMNPVHGADGLSLNISESSNAQDLGLLREVAPFFRLKAKEGEKIIKEVTSVVRQWRKIASKVGLSKAEQDRMESAFRVCEES